MSPPFAVDDRGRGASRNSGPTSSLAGFAPPSFSASSSASYPSSSGSSLGSSMSSNPHCPLPAPSVLFGRHSRFSSALRFDRSSLNGAAGLAGGDGGRSRVAPGVSPTQQHACMYVSLQRKGLRDSDIRDFVQWLSASLQQQLRQLSVGRGEPLLPGGAGGAAPGVSASAPAVSGGAVPGAGGLSKGDRGAGDTEGNDKGGEGAAAAGVASEPVSPFLFTCCLDVSENFITADGLSHLLGFFQAHPSSFRLTKLKLYKNRLGDAGARVLAAYIQSSPLLSSASQSTASGPSTSSSSLRATRSVGIATASRQGKLGAGGGAPSAPLLPPPALEELHLSHCDITAKGCLCLLDAVAAVADDKGRYLYPRYDAMRRSLVPLWLRLEYNHIQDPLSLLKQWTANLKDKRPAPAGSGAPATACGGIFLSFACFAEKLPLSSGGGRSGAAAGVASGSGDGSGAYFHCTPARCCRATATFAPIFHVYMITHQSNGSAPSSNPAAGAAASALASGGNGVAEGSAAAGGKQAGGGGGGPAAALPALIGAHPSAAHLPPRATAGDAHGLQQGRRRSLGGGQGAAPPSAASTAPQGGGSSGGGATGSSQQTSRRGSSGGKKQSQVQQRGRARSSSGGKDARAGVPGAPGSSKLHACRDSSGEGRKGSAAAAWDGGRGEGEEDTDREREAKGGQGPGSCHAPSTGGAKRADAEAEERRDSARAAARRDRRDVSRSSSQKGGDPNGERLASQRAFLEKEKARGSGGGREASPLGLGVEIDKAEVGRCLPLYIFLDASAVLQMAELKDSGAGSCRSSSLFLSFPSLKTLCKENLIVHRGRNTVSATSGGGYGPTSGAGGAFPDSPESDLTLLLVVDAVQQELLGMSRGSFLDSSESSSLGGASGGGRQGIDALEQLHSLATDFCLVEYVGCVQRPQPTPPAAAWARLDELSRQGSGGARRGGGDEGQGDVAGRPGADLDGQRRGRQSGRRGGREASERSEDGRDRSANVSFLLEEDDREEGNDFACLTPNEVMAGQRDAKLSVHTLKTIDYALLWKAHLEEVCLHVDPERDTSDLMFFVTANPSVDAYIRQVAPRGRAKDAGRGGMPSLDKAEGGASHVFLPCILLQDFSLAVESHIESRDFAVRRPPTGLNEDGSAWRPPPLTAADFRLAGMSSLRKETESRRLDYLPPRGASRPAPFGDRGSDGLPASFLGSQRAAGGGPLNECEVGCERSPCVGFPPLSDRTRERRHSNVDPGGEEGMRDGGSVRRGASGGEARRQAGVSSPRLGGGFMSLDESGGLSRHGRGGEDDAYPTFLPPLIGTGFTNEAFLRDSSGSGERLLADTVFGTSLSAPHASASAANRTCGGPMGGGRGSSGSLSSPPPALAALLNSGRRSTAGGVLLGESGAAPDAEGGPFAGSRHGLCNKVMTVAELEEMQLKMRRQQAEAEAAASLDRFVGGPGARGALGRGVEEDNSRSAAGGSEGTQKSPFLLASGGAGGHASTPPDENASGLFGVVPQNLGHGRTEATGGRGGNGSFDAGDSAGSLAAMLPLLHRTGRGGAMDRGLGEESSAGAEEEFLLRQCGSGGSREELLQPHGRHANTRMSGAGLTEVEIKCELIDAIAIVQELSSRVRLLCENSGGHGGGSHGSGAGGGAGDALMKEDLLRRAQDCVTRWRQLLLVANKRQQLQEQAEQQHMLPVGRGADQLSLAPDWQLAASSGAPAHGGLGGGMGPGPASGRGDRSASEGTQQGLPSEAGAGGGGPAVVLPPLQMQQQPHPQHRGAPPSLPPSRCWVSTGNTDVAGHHASPSLHHPWRGQPDLAGPPSLFSQQSHPWGSGGEASNVRGTGGGGRGPNGAAQGEDPRMMGLHPSLQPWRPGGDRGCGSERSGTEDDGALQQGGPHPSALPRSLLPLQRPGPGMQGGIPPGVAGAGPGGSGPAGGCPPGPGGAGGPRGL
ncbi:hypothetical protein BESB_074350 [Besnoitia besnoiti]|uniref:Leucine rich repeat protein n=1 Tax=Besnoitia besnoiti TaxID=94643 RepID=A0A2A9MF41_BESBE|nr:uncharacterized protein BESB_074350 [Besnoitia besnoiti]PFH34283.1 hypothetical protein BESB_074350 [Besnoitia besnoiti]